MIQDIGPHRFHIEFADVKPQSKDKVFVFLKGNLLVRDKEELDFPDVDEFPGDMQAQMKYLFAIDEMRFFRMAPDGQQTDAWCEKGFRFAGRQEFRRLQPKHLAFAAVTGCMLDGWYTANKFCGRCAAILEHDHKERMLFCPECGNRVYPRINPAVIVAVTSGDKLLLTKYRGREYTNYALVAGFTEVGESFEDTVRREVMEEAGLSVKNIRYFGSQPWAFADNLLAGYVCEVDGDEEIKMDEEELSLACWISRKEIPVEYTDSSLTNEMICAFKNHKY